jgi:hypothetical protein
MANMRGSGIFQGSADLMLELRRSEFPSISNVHMVKTRDHERDPVVGELEYRKSGPDGAPIQLRWGSEAENARESRTEEKRARKKQETEQAKEVEQVRLKAQIIAFLRDHPDAFKKNIEEATGSQKPTQRALASLIKEGRVVPHGRRWVLASLRSTYRKPPLDVEDDAWAKQAAGDARGVM